jgi:hypothetical protein
MAEPQVIKKITIKKESLPSFQFTKTFNSEAERFEIDELYYKFRYRIISEDKNRVSFWSPIETVKIPNATAPFPYTATKRISVSSGGTPVTSTAIWTSPEEKPFNISGVSGNGTLITYTTNTNHDFIPGDVVDISGVLPIAYNLTGAVVGSTPSATTFTITNNTSLSYVSGGSAIKKFSDLEKIINSTTVYDVWIRWNNNDVTNLEDSGWTDWEFVRTISSTSFSVIKRDSSVRRVEFAIQISTTEKIRDFFNNKVTIFRALSGTI